MNELLFNSMPEKDRQNRVLEGVAYYSCIHQPNLYAQKEFGEAPCFKVTLGLDSQEEVEKAESYGLVVKPANEKIPHPHVTLKTKIKPEKKPEDVRPSVVDSAQQEVPDNMIIGNGSRIRVKFMTYWHKISPKYGAGNYMTKVQIISLVRYTPPGDTDMGKTEGFKVQDFDSLPESVDPDVPFDPPTKKVADAPKKSNQPPASELDKLFDN